MDYIHADHRFAKTDIQIEGFDAHAISRNRFHVRI